MSLSAILAAVTVAFPSAGQRLPALSRCYMIGATDGCERNLRVSTAEGTTFIPVHRTGAWTALVNVRPGTNVVCVGATKHVFYVGPVTAPATPRTVYPKLAEAADVPKPHPAGRDPSRVTVVIDPGHGGADTGAVSPHGLPEKDANLRLAKAVAEALEARGVRVVMTRTGDAAVALYDRPKVAHAAGADAFISIHHNAPGYGTDPGTCRYQAVYAWNAIGERLAKSVSARMAAAVPELPSKGVLHANYAVTRNPEIPSCLVEADFITHPEGEKAAWDPAERRRLAAAIASGFDDWRAGR